MNKVKVTNPTLKNLSFSGTGGLKIGAYNSRTKGVTTGDLTDKQLAILKKAAADYGRSLKVEVVTKSSSMVQKLSEKTEEKTTNNENLKEATEGEVKDSELSKETDNAPDSTDSTAVTENKVQSESENESKSKSNKETGSPRTRRKSPSTSS